MEERRPIIALGARMACRIVRVVRNHHASMPGRLRDRPGVDRVKVEVPGGGEMVLDLWTRGAQDLGATSGWIEVYDYGDVLMWRALGLSALETRSANDGPLRIAS